MQFCLFRVAVIHIVFVLFISGGGVIPSDQCSDMILAIPLAVVRIIWSTTMTISDQSHIRPLRVRLCLDFTLEVMS